MIEAIVYNFDIVGEFDSINYYRSLIPTQTHIMQKRL